MRQFVNSTMRKCEQEIYGSLTYLFIKIIQVLKYHNPED